MTICEKYMNNRVSKDEPDRLKEWRLLLNLPRLSGSLLRDSRE